MTKLSSNNLSMSTYYKIRLKHFKLIVSILNLRTPSAAKLLFSFSIWSIELVVRVSRWRWMTKLVVGVGQLRWSSELVARFGSHQRWSSKGDFCWGSSPKVNIDVGRQGGYHWSSLLKIVCVEVVIACGCQSSNLIAGVDLMKLIIRASRRSMSSECGVIEMIW